MLEQFGYPTIIQQVTEQNIFDIRTSFVQEYKEDGKIIIKFVKSEENEADIFTKNTTNVIFSNHQK